VGERREDIAGSQVESLKKEDTPHDEVVEEK
jgi:hypothetical protein